MKLKNVASASKSFLRTYEGLRAAHTEPGFERHIEAVIVLVNAFCNETRWPRFMFTACDLYRRVLIGMSNCRLIVRRLRRIMITVWL